MCEAHKSCKLFLFRAAQMYVRVRGVYILREEAKNIWPVISGFGSYTAAQLFWLYGFFSLLSVRSLYAACVFPPEIYAAESHCTGKEWTFDWDLDLNVFSCSLLSLSRSGYITVGVYGLIVPASKQLARELMLAISICIGRTAPFPIWVYKLRKKAWGLKSWRMRFRYNNLCFGQFEPRPS